MSVHIPEHEVFLGQTVNDGTILPPKVADYIQYAFASGFRLSSCDYGSHSQISGHLNKRIPADKDNTFALRTKMWLEDKQLIVDAMRGDPFPPAVYCRQKIMREPRYKPLWELFRQRPSRDLHSPCTTHVQLE